MITAAARGLIPLGILLAACGGGAAAPPPGDEDRMVVEGKIIDVMEIYPPRLNVEAKGDRYTVQLLDETKVVHKEQRVDFGKLRPNQRIRIKGTHPAGTGRLRVNALEIEILEAPSP